MEYYGAIKNTVQQMFNNMENVHDTLYEKEWEVTM